MQVDRTRVWQVVVASVLVVAVLAVFYQAGAFSLPWATNHEQGVVAVTDVESGERTCVVVDVADTQPERFTGLGGRESLANGTGMWFVHGEEAGRTYVMRDMNFAIDIVFVGADGRVNSVATMRAPDPGEDGNDINASGRAKWVLELPRGYANANGIDAGDRVEATYGTGDRSDCPG